MNLSGSQEGHMGRFGGKKREGRGIIIIISKNIFKNLNEKSIGREVFRTEFCQTLKELQPILLNYFLKQKKGSSPELHLQIQFYSNGQAK